MKGRDVGKLFKLRDWLALADAAQHLSIMLQEDVKEADVLRLALDGRLKLSVRFVNYARARRVVSLGGEARIPDLPREKLKGVLSALSQEGETLVLDDGIVPLEGIWDLPLIGSEKLDVEHEYQRLTNGPTVTRICLDGTFVADQDGIIWQLHPEYKKKENLNTPKTAWDDLANCPAGGLPSDSVFVVRASAIQELEAHISEPSKRIERPIGSRERTTLLVIIAGLAKLAKINISKPSSAAEAIESQTELMGARVAARTIENHLKCVPEALGSRSQP